MYKISYFLGEKKENISKCHLLAVFTSIILISVKKKCVYATRLVTQDEIQAFMHRVSRTVTDTNIFQEYTLYLLFNPGPAESGYALPLQTVSIQISRNQLIWICSVPHSVKLYQ